MFPPRWSAQEDSALAEGVASNVKQQLVNPLVQRLQLIRDKLNHIIDPVEIEALTQKKAVTQEELDRVAEFEDLEELMEG